MCVSSGLCYGCEKLALDRTRKKRTLAILRATDATADMFICFNWQQNISLGFLVFSEGAHWCLLLGSWEDPHSLEKKLPLTKQEENFGQAQTWVAQSWLSSRIFFKPPTLTACNFAAR